MAQTHKQMYEKLLKRMDTYHPSKDFSIITRVYEFAVKAHGSQLRKSGDPYMIHPMAVALILADLKCDIETIAGGILHDVVEDTDVTEEEITKKFGKEIAELVKGVTKLKNFKYSSKEEEQAENFRQLFFAMASDIRVILIKMCDRLHNLRTMDFMPRDNQRNKAQETLDIYAPLAHRLGISSIRYDLEDLSFKYLNPDEYNDLREKVRAKLHNAKNFITDVSDTLKERLQKEKINASIAGRSKHMFSIYRKMRSQSKTLDEILDILAVRVIVDTKEDCYKVLGHVHDIYKPLAGRFKDYIAIPKSNNYQSLHTTALAGGKPFEVQIRTQEMNKVAEYGIAAHWKYKQRKGGIVDPTSEEAKFAWLRQIIEWQIDMSDNGEFLAQLKEHLNIFKDHVYCFTPKGDIYSLLNGSTPIDFAYAVHSAIGNRMVGARVNGTIVKFDYTLQNTDQVEIITSNNSKGPSMDWLKIVKTTQARNKINQWFRKENKEENIISGRYMLEREAERKKTDIYELIANKKWMEAVLNRYGLHDWDAICAAVGHGGIKEGQIINRLLEERQKEVREKEFRERPLEAVIKKSESADNANKSGILVQGVSDMAVRISKCCRPVPGDEIVAFITRGRGVTVHRDDCTNVIAMSESERGRLLEAQWGAKTDESYYLTDIRVLCHERHSLITEISKALAEMEHIRVLNFTAKNTLRDTVVFITIEIKHREQLEKVINRLNNISGVYEVSRTCT